MSRVEVALAEIARRRSLAEAATPGPWATEDIRYGDFGWYSPGSPMGETSDSEQGKADARFSAVNDPAHVLAVLDAADAVLRRHERETQGGWANACRICDDDPWPCPDAAAVLGLYAPQS